MYKNYKVNIKLIFFVIGISLVYSCGGGSSSPQINSSEPPPNSAPKIFNIDAAFDYALQDNMFTQQVSVLANGELNTKWRDITLSEKNKVLEFGYEDMIANFEGNEQFDELTSWSTGKSILSIIIGISADQGLLSLDDAASKYLTEWNGDEQKEKIKLRDLLNMRSGLLIPEGDDAKLTRQDDQFNFCVNSSVAEDPDNKFEYNNCNSMLLGKVVERATGQDFSYFAETFLFAPLDIKATWWKHIVGNYLTYCFVDMSQKDFIRFGEMVLNKGEDVVSESYIDEIFSGYDDYNLQFWLRDDTIQTIGFDGQYIVIDFINEFVAARNSLYYASTNGDYIMSIKGDVEDYTLPITLPQIVTGQSTSFDMKEFLRILRSP